MYPCAVFMSSTVELALLTFSFILVPQAVWRDFLGHLLLESWCCQSMCPQATSPLRLRPSRNRRHRKRTGVSEQIKNPLPRGIRPEPISPRFHIQKKAMILIPIQ